jgi:hypothetical protein
MPLGAGPLDRQDDGIFFFRPDGQDERFLRGYLPEGDFGAAILAGRLLAPHPVGSIERDRGARGDELLWTLEDASTPWIGDPDTPHLAHCTRAELPAKRLGLMAHAELYELPWTQDLLADDDALQAIVRNALAAYHRSFAASAVYFEASATDDPFMKINLRAVAETKASSGGRPVCAFVQMPLEALMDGTMANMSARYAHAGARIAVLRVVGFHAEECTAEQGRAYIDCVRAWRACGILPIADCTGRFGAALVAAGGWGFSAGARFYRRVIGPGTLPFDGFRRARTVHLEISGEWRSMTAAQARRRRRLPRCDKEDCDPLATDNQPTRLKAHCVHEFVRLARSAAALGEARIAAQLQAAPGGQSSVWASALLARRAAQER